MVAIGAKYRLREGKIYHAARLWRSPSKRRIPRLLIEDRALEVGIKIYLEEPWMVFEETKENSESISTNNATQLQFYLNRFHLLPSKIGNVDTFNWLKKPDNKLLLWGKENKYFVKPISN